jgi:hypothetical protein
MSAQYNPSDLKLPVVLDMTAVTWQTRRVPKGGKEYENRDVHGTGTVYMDKAFVLDAYSGVLRVTAEIVNKPPDSGFSFSLVRIASLLISRPSEFRPASMADSAQFYLFLHGVFGWTAFGPIHFASLHWCSGHRL